MGAPVFVVNNNYMSVEQINKVRHSICHLMSMAVQEIYPKVGLGVGPFIEDGFYQDYDLPESISEEILPKLEKRIKKMIAQNIEFKQHEVGFKEALKMYKHDPYKTEMIKDLKKAGEKSVSFYRSDWFENLCAGPHVKNTSEINPKAFKLTKVAGAYWRGDENKKMLTRIYGVAFDTKDQLAKHLAMLEEAKKRDHRKLGRDLDLFVFSDLVGAGLPLYTRRGTTIRSELEQFVYDIERPYGYQRVRIPHITKKELYETSGHWEKFGDELFRIKSREGHEFALKPMNCPHHTQIYASQKRSYRELPIRYKEVTAVYRDEQSGELSGLSRVRMITQDDGHVFCRMNHIMDECLKIWDIIDKFYKPFGMPLEVRFSTHDPKQMEKYLGAPKVWKAAEKELLSVIKKRGIKNVIEDKGEAAMYGPKIDFIAKDAIGREWQLATIQLDFNLPERFNLTCVNENGKEERIVMIHRAILGAVERFMAILIEHYAGAFPVWLAPVQVCVAPVGKEHYTASRKLEKMLKEQGMRVEIDEANETVSYKVRKAEKMKIPYILVVGDREKSLKKLTVRIRGQKPQPQMTVGTFVKRVKGEIEKKK